MNYRISKHGTVLASRPTGSTVRTAIEKILKTLPKGEALVLDIKSIIAISPSCADELFGRLYSALQADQYGDRLILLSNVTSDHEEILEPILKRRGIVAAKQLPKSITLLGAAGHLTDTYKVARRMKHFTASEIATKLGLKVPAMDNRLKKLWSNRLLDRELGSASHGGREYVYNASP